MTSPGSLRSLLVALAGIALVLLAGELVVRTWIESPSVAIPDSRFGWRYPPHVTLVRSSEGYSVQRTNALGLLGAEVRPARPRLRVLLVGDSYAEALQVRPDQSFGSIAQRLVPGSEVIDAGVSGHNLLDHAEWVAIHADALRPDVIVIELTDGNLEDLLKPANLARFDHPPGPGTEDPPVVEGRLHRLLRGLMRRSALVTVAWRRLDLLAADQRARLSRRFQEASARPAPVDRARVATDPRLPAMLDSLHARIARHAPRVIYVYVPHIEYFAPGCPVSYPGAAALVRAFAARQRVTLVDATKGFQEEYARTGQPVHGFANTVIGTGHINAAGHRVVGEELARALAEPAIAERTP